MDLFCWQVVPSERQYDYIKVLGRTSIWSGPVPYDRDNRVRYPDYLFQQLSRTQQSVLTSRAGEFYCSKPSIKAIDKSIKKMDVGRIFYEDTPHWDQACDLVWEKVGALFKLHSRFMGLEELYTTFDLTTASGIPWVKMGLRTKADCLGSSVFWAYFVESVTSHRPPLWRVSYKHEWLASSDLDEGKGRTFIIPPFHYLLLQKMCFQSQNSALKNFWWSAYGFNPYMGGTDRLAKSLLVENRFMYYDVRGWDRILQVMQDVYDLRLEYLYPRVNPLLLEWVSYYAINSYLVLPDGTLIYKEWGNNSGSGNTTTDNILGHMLILATALLELYEDPCVVMKIIAVIFGDDNLTALPYHSFSNEEIEEVVRGVFKSFGFDLDPFKITDNLEECSFLGFEFVQHPLGWIPKYNMGRIVSSFCYTIEKGISIQKSISRAWSLTVMSAGDEEVFKDLSEALYEYLAFQQDSTDPIVKSFVQMGVPTYEACINFFLGLECSLGLFDYDVLMEVGGFKIQF